MDKNGIFDQFYPKLPMWENSTIQVELTGSNFSNR